MKKYSRCAVFCIAFTISLVATSVFAQRASRVSRSSCLTAVPSGPTILSLASGVKKVGALSVVDAITKGSSNISLNSAAFTHGAQINSNNASMVQGASSMQAGTSAGSTTFSSDLLTGHNLITAGKAATGHEGNAIKAMQRSALASINSSTWGSAETKIKGDAGTLGNSSFSQSNTVLGSTASQGPVTGSVGVVSFSGNSYNPNS